jgi:hypothetical protein
LLIFEAKRDGLFGERHCSLSLLKRKNPTSLFTTLSGWLISRHSVLHSQTLFQWDLVQPDILDSGPDNGQAAHFRREGINLISTLSYIAEPALNRIGRL